MTETRLTNNWLFAAMDTADQDALRPSLVRRELRSGEILFQAGDDVDVIHFPVSAQIANVMRLSSGDSLAVSSVGREGVTGLAAFMAIQPVGWDAVAHVAGVIWTVPSTILRGLAGRSPGVARQLLEATHHNQVEAHKLAICATFHLALPRLARWILTMQERTGQSSFALTQEDFAHLLGVQRTTINEAMIDLRAAGALSDKTRGKVVIQDRYALKALACGCHRLI